MSRPINQGIYILGNDRVIDDVVALMQSLRRFAPDDAVRLIPYDDQHHRLARILHERFGVEIFEDGELFRELSAHAIAICGKDAHMFRKFACWFGPFQKFVYFDADILVFQDQADVFDLLVDHDIVYCGSGRTMGIREVFTERVFDRHLFSDLELRDLFNAGFFASKRGVLERHQLLECLAEAQEVSDIFAPHLQDQPVLNYVVLKMIPNRANLRELAPTIHSDAWAGRSNLRIRDDRIFIESAGTVRPVRHLHWAGFHQIPDRPYVNLWLRYRYPGTLGMVQRPAVRFKWWVDKVLRRLLHTHLDGWYRPSYQAARLKRIISRL